jgi:hypothetical protein
MRFLQALTPADRVKRHEFCEEKQLKMEVDGFVERLVFSDEATFYISGKYIYIASGLLPSPGNDG